MAKGDTVVAKRLLLVLGILLVASGAWADCNPAATDVVLSRTSIHKPNVGYCDWEVPLNLNWQKLEDQGCFAISGVLNCGATFTQGAVAVLDKVTSADDLFEFFVATRPTTLLSVGCHCDVNCTTVATLTFEDRGGNAIGITGGGSLSCSSSSSATTFTTFSTSDADRILVDGEGVRLNVTNTPTTDQRITIVLKYTTP